MSQSMCRIWRETGNFGRKCGICLIRGLQFFYTSWLISTVAAPKEELQFPDEEKATFSQKCPDFSSNSTRFLGSKVAIFFCGKVRKIFADYEEKSKLRKNLADFSAKKGPLSTPKNESISRRIWVFFQKMWHFSHPESTILRGNDYLGDQPPPPKELQSPDEEKTIFSSNWGSEIGSKNANFSDF